MDVPLSSHSDAVRVMVESDDKSLREHNDQGCGGSDSSEVLRWVPYQKRSRFECICRVSPQRIIRFDDGKKT